MTLIIALNVVFSAFVIFGIVALHLHAIAKSHVEQVRANPVAAGAHAVPVTSRATRDRERADGYTRAPAPARA